MQRYHAHYGTSGERHVTKKGSKVPDTGRRSLFRCIALRGAKCFARQFSCPRGGLAEDWKWGSLFRWLTKPEPEPKLLSPWPIARLPNWANRVNEPLSDRELEAVRWSIKRGSPFGCEAWIESTARRLELESTLRPRGRPQVRFFPKTSNNDS